MPLRLRRGTNAERLSITPLEGEILYVTDLKKVFVGDGTTVGGVDIVQTLGGALTGNLDLNTNSIYGAGNVDIFGNITGLTIKGRSFEGDLVGSVFSDDSTVMVDSVGKIITNGTLTLRGNSILSTPSGFSGLGNSWGTLRLASSSNRTQVVRDWNDITIPLEINVGLSGSYNGMSVEYKASNGVLGAPTQSNPGDGLGIQKFYGHDGNDYFLSSIILAAVGNEPISPGVVPGNIIFGNYGYNGLQFMCWNSEGRLGINNLGPSAELDVLGNAKISGSVEAASFKGTLVGDDSTVYVDGINGTLSNGTLTLGENIITSINNELNIGRLDNPIRVLRYWDNAASPIEITKGLSTTFSGLVKEYYASQGTLDTPLSSVVTDGLHVERYYGHDGSNYVLSSTVLHLVDTIVPSPGVVPGYIMWANEGPSGTKLMVYDSDGYLGINTTDPLVHLHVVGDGLITGDLVAAGFEFVGNNITTTDSSNVIIGQATNIISDLKVDGRVTATEFDSDAVGVPEIVSATELRLSAGIAVVIKETPLRLAKFTTAERATLIPENGDMIYNTTVNKFQGYQNGAWINLEDGSLA